MKIKKLTALLLALAMAFALAACGLFGDEPNPTGSPSGGVPESTQPSQGPTQEPSSEPSVGPSTEPSEDPVETADVPGSDGVRLGILSGPAAIGAVKLLSDSDAAGSYRYVIESDGSTLAAGLTGDAPTFDIAIMSSNSAVDLYNRTGQVKIIALGTLGGLQILEGGGRSDIRTIADLAGETVWCAGQGEASEYILRYLLRQNGLTDGEDVEIAFAGGGEIADKLLSGQIRYAILPVPEATAAVLQSNGSVRAAIDVTEAWDGLNSGSRLVMTAVVARTAFLQEQPEAVAAFLADYRASVSYVSGSVDEAARLAAEYGLAPSVDVARQVIPQCRLTYIAGGDMVGAVSDYFQALWSVDRASVGGYLPDDAIYYVP